CLRGAVDARDRRTELRELRSGLACPALDDEDALAVQVGERVTHRRREPRFAGDCLRAPTVHLLPRAQIVVGGLHHTGSEKPPSTTRVWPRTISASGEQRNVTAAARSSASTSRFAGVRSRKDESISSLFGNRSRAPVSTSPAEA